MWSNQKKKEEARWLAGLLGGGNGFVFEEGEPLPLRDAEDVIIVFIGSGQTQGFHCLFLLLSFHIPILFSWEYILDIGFYRAIDLFERRFMHSAFEAELLISVP